MLHTLFEHTLSNQIHRLETLVWQAGLISMTSKREWTLLPKAMTYIYIYLRAFLSLASEGLHAYMKRNGLCFPLLLGVLGLVVVPNHTTLEIERWAVQEGIVPFHLLKDLWVFNISFPFLVVPPSCL